MSKELVSLGSRLPQGGPLRRRTAVRPQPSRRPYNTRVGSTGAAAVHEDLGRFSKSFVRCRVGGLEYYIIRQIFFCSPQRVLLQNTFYCYPLAVCRDGTSIRSLVGGRWHRRGRSGVHTAPLIGQGTRALGGGGWGCLVFVRPFFATT